MKTTEDIVCQECKQPLTSWAQNHTWFDCERYKNRLRRKNP